MLRIHCETDLLEDSAARYIRSSSFAPNRTGTIFPLASPFGNFGRPGFRFLGCFGIAQLLHDGDSNGGFLGYGGRDFQDCDAALWLLWVVGFVRPGITLWTKNHAL